jgi:hypothetical protein
MKAYHLQWTDTGSEMSSSGEEYPVPIPVDSYAFIEGNYVIEFDFGMSGERIQIWDNDVKQAETIVREFERIRSRDIDENTKHYCVESLFERDYEVK